MTPDLEGGGGDATIEARLFQGSLREPPSAERPRFFSAYFCPFAQRTWIALEEKGIEYDWCEVDIYMRDKDGEETKNPKPLDVKAAENPGFIEASPRGLVPALVVQGEEPGVCESLVCCEYLDERFPEAPPLMPLSPKDRARVRIALERLSAETMPHFYKLLMQPLEADRAVARSALLEGMRLFSTRMDPAGEGINSASFFLGDVFSIADIALVPWFVRLQESWLGQHRGFFIPDSPEYGRLRAWGEAIKQRPSVLATIIKRERIIQNYRGYLLNTATSAVAMEYRSGVAAPAPAFEGEPAQKKART